MTKPAGYIAVPNFLIQADSELQVDLHLHLPENDTVVFFRGKGVKLSASDREKLSKLRPESMIAPEAQRDELTRWIGQEASKFLETPTLETNEPISPSALTGTAELLLSPLEQPTQNPYGEIDPGDSRELLSDVSTLVEQVVLRFKQTRSAKDYEALLRESKGATLDPLQTHQRQVSALSVVILMSSGVATMEELSELATAALVHDLGMNEITLSIRDRHVVGMDDEFNPSEKLIHLRHLELGLERLKARKIKLTPGAAQIILEHHENWDGTGFRGTPGPQICRPARALRIADDLVSWVSNIMNAGGLPGAYADLKRRASHYDPELMASLGEALGEGQLAT
jgi:HD-GYP domain-containing protein (c-di-GMP phosphodiesterase class II)